ATGPHYPTIFEAPTAYEVPGIALKDVSDPQWYTEVRPPLTRDGILPQLRYVIREKGKLEGGSLSCANCHLSVAPSGAVIKAGQGNFPLDRVNVFFARRSTLQEQRTADSQPAVICRLSARLPQTGCPAPVHDNTGRITTRA